jgi:exopolyphosphatase/guanosine-5'-triphosphate,3'-diphosphate pyrophosphatase
MRIGVLDVGSNSAHLKVVDLWPGEPPRPVTEVKHPTRLAEAIDRDGRIDEAAIDGVVRAIGNAAQAAEEKHVDELIAFATSAIRDAVNRESITARVAGFVGIELGFLSGRDEARLTFAAARDWYGWSAGPMLLLDIGGGSLEIAYGDGQEPEVALSLPLGAGRLTREHLLGDPPRRKDVRRLSRHVAGEVQAATRDLRDRPAPVRVVATSKTFKQLARLTGATTAKAGPYARRVMDRDRLRKQIPVLAGKTAQQRARLKGVSKPRAHQILAGAIVADAVTTVFDLHSVDICPWALREGVIAQRMRSLPGFGMIGDLTDLMRAPSERPPLRPVPDGAN